MKSGLSWILKGRSDKCVKENRLVERCDKQIHINKGLFRKRRKSPL